MKSNVFSILLACAAFAVFAPRAGAMDALRGQTNGVPLGGVGAGSFEILPDGAFANLTINNNRTAEQRIASSRGAFFAVRTESNNHKVGRILTTTSQLFLAKSARDPRSLYLKSTGIHYTGYYPKATLRYSDISLPVKPALTAFSPIIPHDERASAMPAAIFVFNVENPNKVSVTTTVAFSWENLNGNVGKFVQQNRSRESLIRDMKSGRLEGLLFGHRGTHRQSIWGQYAVMADCPGNDITARQWAPLSADSTADLWDDLMDDGRLTNEVLSQPGQFAGALACRTVIPAKTTVQVAFVLSWYFPHYLAGDDDMGNWYTTLWPDAEKVAREALAKRRDLLARVDGWQRYILHSNLPDDLRDMLINNLYVLTTNTLHTSDDRYSIMETPAGPMMGTLDQRFYSSIATLLFFPGLEKKEMRLFGDSRHPKDQGRIFHDLGYCRLDQPKTGTTDKRWTDLNPKFVLMAWRDYLWTGDAALLADLYPMIKQAMAYTLRQDENSAFLPTQHGRSTTYDDWAFHGVNSYASSLWLAAIQAHIRIAGVMHDTDEARRYSEIYPKAAASFERLLWDQQGGYYYLYNDPAAKAEADHPAINPGCHDGQLAGQWYADFLKLGRLFPQDHIARAIQRIHTLNEKPFGVAKGLMPDGAPVANPSSENWWSESENGWPGYETAHYAAFAVTNGRPEIGLGVAEKQYENIHRKFGLTWNQPLRWDLTKNGPYGWGADRYMTSPSIWHLLIALEGFALDTPSRAMWFQPSLPKGAAVFVAPLFTPETLGMARFKESGAGQGYEQRVAFQFDRGLPLRTLYLRIPKDVASVTARAGRTIVRKIHGKNKSATEMIAVTEVRLTDEPTYRTARVTFAKEQSFGPAVVTVRLTASKR